MFVWHDVGFQCARVSAKKNTMIFRKSTVVSLREGAPQLPYSTLSADSVKRIFQRAPSEPAARTENSLQSFSERGRIWQKDTLCKYRDLSGNDMGYISLGLMLPWQAPRSDPFSIALPESPNEVFLNGDLPISPFSRDFKKSTTVACLIAIPWQVPNQETPT